jgi:hypothetical protein
VKNLEALGIAAVAAAMLAFGINPFHLWPSAERRSEASVQQTCAELLEIAKRKSCGLEEQLLQLEAAASPDTGAVLELAELAQQLQREIYEMEVECAY